MRIPLFKITLPAFLALFLGFFSQLFSIATADVVLLYDFDDQNGQFTLDPELADPALTPLEWQVQSSSLRDFGGNPGRAMASSGFSQANAFELTVGVTAGQVLSLDSIAFDQLASSSGPNAWQLLVNGDAVATGSTTSSYTAATADLALAPFSEAFTVSIFASGASSNRGTFRVDNFTVAGSLQPVPLPPALPLMVTSMLGLYAVRRRKSSPRVKS